MSDNKIELILGAEACAKHPNIYIACMSSSKGYNALFGMMKEKHLKFATPAELAFARIAKDFIQEEKSESDLLVHQGFLTSLASIYDPIENKMHLVSGKLNPLENLTDENISRICNAWTTMDKKNEFELSYEEQTQLKDEKNSEYVLRINNPHIGSWHEIKQEQYHTSDVLKFIFKGATAAYSEYMSRLGKKHRMHDNYGYRCIDLEMFDGEFFYGGKDESLGKLRISNHHPLLRPITIYGTTGNFDIDLFGENKAILTGGTFHTDIARWVLSDKIEKSEKIEKNRFSE